MRILVIAVSRMRAGPELDLVKKFADRIRRSGQPLGIVDLEIIEVDESRAQNGEQRKRQEGEKLLKAIPSGSFVVALDETGKNLSSRKFSDQFARWRDDGYATICFIIGGPDGLDDEVRRKANLKLSFGQATWPHMLVRVMMLEQLYRTTTLLLGHPYHRD